MPKKGGLSQLVSATVSCCRIERIERHSVARTEQLSLPRLQHKGSRIERHIRSQLPHNQSQQIWSMCFLICNSIVVPFRLNSVADDQHENPSFSCRPTSSGQVYRTVRRLPCSVVVTPRQYISTFRQSEIRRGHPPMDHVPEREACGVVLHDVCWSIYESFDPVFFSWPCLPV